MVFSLGLKLFLQGFFHLLTHAVAKAKLFVNVGYLMLNKNHHQDSRILTKNFFNSILKRVFSVYSILSLSGIVFFRGFFSKERIIEKKIELKKFFVLFCIYLIIFFRLIYGFRLIFLLKFKKNNFKKLSSIRNTKILRVFFLTLLRIYLGKILKIYFLRISLSVKFFKIIYYILIVFGLIFSCFVFFR